MLGANNLTEIFDYLFPIVAKKLGKKIEEILNKQNSTGSSPLRIKNINLDYAVITNSKEMVVRLLEAGVDPNLKNESGRTAFSEAE